ncbi:Heavy metal transport/detoxification superfamily protein [Quillaja saponaria]|uniref:Heavy metal transport/detoxification superfamily protein n=1 Tax=Quillaja saponaria TaxID=32244 RepID=A0AAD7LTF8_QUISA|nr:Heavy metal transport/detoxification superfamily protein [Quillaja saponaria]
MTNVVELKVGLHCDDCIKKILKAIKKIEDIETYNVDTKLNKVIVTGNVTTQQVIKVLQKIGKNASHLGGRGKSDSFLNSQFCKSNPPIRFFILQFSTTTFGFYSLLNLVNIQH